MGSFIDASRSAQMAGARLARFYDQTCNERRVRYLDLSDLGDFRRWPDCAWMGLHSISDFRGFHGGRAAPRCWSVREEPPDRSRPSVAMAQSVFCQAALRRSDLVYRRADLPADDGVDARSRHHLRAVLRVVAVLRAWGNCAHAVFNPGRVGNARS